ncbi:MAG TPA: S41 family peptidase [Bacteroidales bacterium]|nr:S41 family peptidase [Bacteroidales bacterium]
MKKITIVTIILFTLFSFKSIAQENTAYFLTEPTLSPDGQEIVFVYENDLWQVKTYGGIASRLTAMDGVESNPRFSPDGQWIAFSSEQNGNADVYILPVHGGEITQLTYHEANDYVDSWSWNSKTINFTSNRYNVIGSYKIAVNGGTPKRLFGDNYFNNAHHLAELPEENAYLFTESWESFMFPHRKRYKGDHNPDIKYYNATTNEYKELTTYNGKDLWPVTDIDGNIYFASDEKNSVYNLFTFENSNKKQLTNFNTAIQNPQVSANGEKVVFTKDYQIHVYNVKTNSTQKPKIKIYKNKTLDIHQKFNVQGKVSTFDISPDNKKIAFVSRGRLFVSDIKGKFVKEINTQTNERVVEVKWMEDNENLLYTRTNKGWTNIFKTSAIENTGEKQITFENKTERYIEFSPNHKKAVYISGSSPIHLLDLKSLNVEKIIEDEFWFRGSQPHFSPDGDYIVYTAFRNFEPDVFIYDIKQKKSINITHNGVPENDPVWSPDGKYLYISANRFFPGYPRGKGTNKIFRIPLYQFAKNFKSEEYENLFKKENKKDTTVEVRFTLENIEKRWEEVANVSGEHHSPYIFKEKDKEILFFNSYTDDSKSSFNKVELTPFEKVETKSISDHSYSMIVKSKTKYYALINGSIHEVNVSGNKTDKISIDYNFSKNLNDEFEQMFYENWAALAENFYDVNYHGIDWQETRNYYEQFLPYIRNRENLRQLQIDMLGELNASHLDFRTHGEEQKIFYKLRSNETGILFDEDNPYKVKEFVTQSPIDILDNPIMAGDELIAVNDVKTSPSKNRNVYFNHPEILDEIKLTFKRGKSTYDVKIHPITSRKFNSLLNDQWIASKQKIVDEASDKKIAYVYMKDMGSGSLEDFLIDMTTEAVHRDALILDLRYNRGGNVHDEVLQFLSQKPYLKWKYRDGKLSPQPNFAPAGKPIVLLINEHSLSDAEMTAAGFKQLKLGKIIGTETYRWIIFTSARRLVDGSYTRLPAWGCYTLDGKDLEKTGVAPDIYVKNTFMDRLNNSDPQLEKAVKELLKELE